jgi:radical SAM protein with 4Fe4S-binding SPASM domain
MKLKTKLTSEQISYFENLTKLDIEYSHYCNRTCEWCPNSFIDRRSSPDLFMDWDSYTRLIGELKELFSITKRGKPLIINFARYNEPFANYEMLKKYVNYAREQLGWHAEFWVNTNGDYFRNKKVDLSEISLDYIAVMDYDNIGRTEITRIFTENLGVSIRNQALTHVSADYIGNNHPIKLHWKLNWTENNQLEDRGSLLRDKEIKSKDGSSLGFKNNLTERKVPCFEISKHPTIDYNGNIMPCCHLRSDADEHKGYALGNIFEESFISVMTNDFSKEFARRLENMDFPDVCKTCHK